MLSRALLQTICCVLASQACAPRAQHPPRDTRRTVLSLKKLDCGPCGERLAQKMSVERGVEAVHFNQQEAEIVVLANPSYDALARARALQGGDAYEVVEGAGQGGYLPWAEPLGGDVRVLSEDGADVPDLERHRVAGKVTVFDFSALWCEPCRVLDEHMLEVASKKPDVAYRKLDIGDWDTPLSKRYLKGLRRLPYVIVYGRDGRVTGEVSGLDERAVDQAIERGLAP